jgi:hypothetical protein
MSIPNLNFNWLLKCFIGQFHESKDYRILNSHLHDFDSTQKWTAQLNREMGVTFVTKWATGLTKKDMNYLLTMSTDSPYVFQDSHHPIVVCFSRQ